MQFRIAVRLRIRATRKLVNVNSDLRAWEYICSLGLPERADDYRHSISPLPTYHRRAYVNFKELLSSLKKIDVESIYLR